MPRSVDDANQCVTDVLAFLASFHSLGYVHRDLMAKCFGVQEWVMDRAKSIPPDAFHHDGFTFQHDLQMFGKMLGEIGEELSNSAAYKFGVFLQKKGHYKNITNAVNGWRSLDPIEYKEEQQLLVASYVEDLRKIWGNSGCCNWGNYLDLVLCLTVVPTVSLCFTNIASLSSHSSFTLPEVVSPAAKMQLL
ncbi:hypothetical protein PROFUN_14939 [Planoprotostelium fungivorum]|uniref:Uncharacterized protein n=1 Tax=Planoprotostelium fungivorum TaxID=1890364 RepID=A0A2P6MYB2_9EUKA|nr:hypothetical protein PROFUN_14939 [Planoprotostelium fungivorum]